MNANAFFNYVRHSIFAVIIISQMSLFLRSEVSNYTGDGEIKDISFRHLIWNVKGYEINFDEFPLNAPKCSEYRLENLPKFRKVSYVYFKVCGVEDGSDIGILNLVVRDMDGKSVAMLRHKPLKDMIWSKDSGDPCYYIYDLNMTKFMAEKGMHYKVSFEFAPKGDAGEAVGSLYIRCGGSL